MAKRFETRMYSKKDYMMWSILHFFCCIQWNRYQRRDSGMLRFIQSLYFIL